MKKDKKIHLDFVINSRPLTKEEEISISEYILAYKAKHSHKKGASKRVVKSIAKKKAVA